MTTRLECFPGRYKETAMAKKVFAVTLDKEGRSAAAEVVSRLKKEYGADNVYPFASGVTFVAVPPSSTTNVVSKIARIKGKTRDTTGVVFKLNSAYSGYTDTALWAWLEKAQGA